MENQTGTIDIGMATSADLSQYKTMLIDMLLDSPDFFAAEPKEYEEFTDEERIKKLEENKYSYVVGSKIKDELVGLLHIRRCGQAKFAHVVEIGQGYVVPEWRGNKLFSKMLHKVHEIERQHHAGFFKIRGTTHELNHAMRSLLKKQGYTEYLSYMPKEFYTNGKYYDEISYEKFFL